MNSPYRSAAGIIARVQDKGNHYILRANALEGNVNLYKYAGGQRSGIKDGGAKVAAGGWQELRLQIAGDRLRGLREFEQKLEQRKLRMLFERYHAAPLGHFRISVTTDPRAADSSALPEQASRDVVRSAFDSAGQRCSAARLFFVQEDVAAAMVDMLVGAVAALDIGKGAAEKPRQIGPGRLFRRGKQHWLGFPPEALGFPGATVAIVSSCQQGIADAEIGSRRRAWPSQLPQRLERGGQCLVGLVLLHHRVPLGREPLERQRVELVGDRGHWDGHQYFTITGHPYIINRQQNTILYGDAVKFDMVTQKAQLINGRGESTQGVEKGLVYYSFTQGNAEANGVAHGTNASITTCERPRSGYHITGRDIDVKPGDRITLYRRCCG